MTTPSIMMEVTPHLKNVLKNYQHSATKSLQGPGLLTKSEIPSPELKEEEFIPASFPVQQLPILTTPDTSCSERTETVLEGETISCFVIGGEKRLCLPQVLNSVLRDFSLPQINHECDQLQIYCSRCTQEQVTVLKTGGVLPPSAGSSGLITKTDAERLCSALLYQQDLTPIRANKSSVSFTVYHKCFGKCTGVCFPELYTSKTSKCIECSECRGGFSPQQFVCHVHKHYSENRTVHWGFDSDNWRLYLKVPEEDEERCKKYLDEMKEQYEGKAPFPNVFAGIKRKQVLPTDVLKDHDLPPKKQKIIGEYINPLQYNHFYASLETIYLNHCIQGFQVANRHLSAFKPVNNHKEPKMPYNHLSMATNPPVLQNPERVVLNSESERFERTFQPNVALAPTTPKKYRYGKFSLVKEKQEVLEVKKEDVKDEIIINNNTEVIVKPEVEVKQETQIPSPPKEVSVLQTNPRYNSEIELSTDTEDSASETSEKFVDLGKMEEVLKDADASIRERVLESFRNLLKDNERWVMECRSKDDRIRELEVKVEELERKEPQEKEKNCSSIIQMNDNCEENQGPKTKSVIANLESTEPTAIMNNSE